MIDLLNENNNNKKKKSKTKEPPRKMSVTLETTIIKKIKS